ncbi:MAG: LamG-like jellyroll fold domain-containing protein [Minisyncoccota bacterium]
MQRSQSESLSDQRNDLNLTQKARVYFWCGGQSLVEILVGLGVISIMVGASTYALVTVLRSSTITEQSQSAGLIGNSLLESVSTLSEANWNAVYNLQKTLSNHYFLIKSSASTPTAITGDESVLEQDVFYGLLGHWKLDEISGINAYDSSSNDNLGTLTNMVDINSGLVGYWKFDEGSGSIATDFSGNNYTGTLTNSPTREVSKDCKWGGCLSFDGLDDYVVSPDVSNGFDVNYATISGWMYKTANAADHHTVMSRNSNSFIINFYGSTFETYFFTSGGTCYNSGISYTQYLNGWHHFAASYNGSESKLYIDGALVKTQTGCSGFLNTSSEGVYIGTRGSVSGRLAAKLDDVRIYNRALADSEISRLYNMNNCKVGNCLNFDGVDDVIDFGNISSFNFVNEPFSLSTWFKNINPSGYDTIMGKGGFWANDEYQMFTLGGLLYFYVSKGDVRYSTTYPILSDQWYYAVGVYDGSAIKLYVNGVLVNQTAVSDLNITNTSSFRIGRAGSDPFSGLIDDARVYDRALSATEITQLYNSPVYSRYFYVDNVNRTNCGTGDVTTDAESECLGTTGVSQDPATQKITVGTSWSLKGANENIENSIFVSRWINSVTEQSDWGGSNSVSGAVSEFSNDYFDYSNISTTTSGAIKISGI